LNTYLSQHTTTEIDRFEKVRYLHFRDCFLTLKDGGAMRRGAYPMDLTRQIKVRIDENTFEKITQLSEQKETTKSWIVRDIITRWLCRTFHAEM